MKRNLNRIIYIWRELGVTKGDGGTQLLSWSDPKIKESTTDWDTERSSILFSEGRTSTAISFPGGEFQSAWTLQHQWGTQYIYVCLWALFSMCKLVAFSNLQVCQGSRSQASYFTSTCFISTFTYFTSTMSPSFGNNLYHLLWQRKVWFRSTVFTIHLKGSNSALCSPLAWKGSNSALCSPFTWKDHIQHCVHLLLESVKFNTVFISHVKMWNSVLCSPITWKGHIQQLSSPLEWKGQIQQCGRLWLRW